MREKGEKNMKEKRKNSILGPTGRLLVDTKPVGGRIPRNEYDEWLKFKSRCSIAGIQMNPDGMVDMVKTYNRINEVIFPMASSYDFKPIKLKNIVLDIMLKAIKEMDADEWKDDSKKVKHKIKTRLEKAVKVNIQ